MRQSWSLPLCSFRALPNVRVIPLSNLIKEQLQAVAARRYGQWKSAVVCTLLHVLIMSLALNPHMRVTKILLYFVHHPILFVRTRVCSCYDIELVSVA